jgi:DNA-directed RNA polymerase subunit RPC12/RpoP
LRTKTVKCPRCGYVSQIDLSLSPKILNATHYDEPRQLEIECKGCGFKFYVDPDDRELGKYKILKF